ncbi:uncharacterized protein LOC134691534, partial [Mytilus trossulus]|uniref:uncharacterized protein LOC134691534 n=1 Tax=Mytilus trossulus TaxID=6551 RepID=UPI0030043CA9
MASNVTNVTRTTLSEIEYQEFLENDIPATIFLAFLSVVGTIGNTHTIVVYMLSPIMSNYSVRVFIIWHAFIDAAMQRKLTLSSICFFLCIKWDFFRNALNVAADLTACVFGMPFENFVLRYSYTFSSVGACKFFKFLNHISTGTSTLLLTAIAIERYKMVVKKSPILITNSQRSNAISGVLLALVLVLSIPAVVFYGLNNNKSKISGLSGKECRILSEYQNMRAAGCYYSIVLVIGLGCVVVCIISYGRILYEICSQKEWRKSQRKKSNSFSNSPSNIRSEVAQVTSSIQNEEFQINNLQTGCGNRTKKKCTNSSHNLGNAIQLTINL